MRVEGRELEDVGGAFGATHRHKLAVVRDREVADHGWGHPAGQREEVLKPGASVSVDLHLLFRPLEKYGQE